MQCPGCGFVFTDAVIAQCPRCGSPLRTAPPATTPGGDSLGHEQTATPFPPSTGSSPSYSSGAGYSAYPAYPTYPTSPSQPTPPGYFAPPSAPLPSGSYAPPSAPLPPTSYAPPSAPFVYPPYGPQGVPGYMPPPPPPPRRRGPTTAIISSVLVVIAVVAACGAAVLLSHTTGAPASTPGAQTSYSGTVTHGATATTPPGQHMLFQDDFSSNTSGWLNDSKCSYGADGYHVADAYICYAPTGATSDSIVSADIKQTAGDITWFYGIVFRRASKGNFYELFIDSDGKWEFNKVVNNTRTHLLPYVPAAAIHTGLNASNTVTARAIGSHFEFFVNGTQVGQFDDSTFSSGRCGLASAGDGQVQIVATHFSLALPN